MAANEDDMAAVIDERDKFYNALSRVLGRELTRTVDFLADDRDTRSVCDNLDKSGERDPLDAAQLALYATCGQGRPLLG